MLRFADAIDRLSAWIGHLIAWLTLGMVVLGAGNAVARHLGRYLGHSLSSNTYIELQWYLFSLVFLFGAATTLRQDGHVRVDVLYGRLGPRGRAWIDLLGTLLFLVPFTVLLLVTSWPAVRNSWAIAEMSPDPGGLPRYPLKASILVACSLLLLQGLALAIRQLPILLGPSSTAASDRP